mgnify:CR=1 FL=1
MIYQGSIFNIWTQKIACRDGVWYRGGPNNYWLVYGYSKTLTSFIFAGPFTAKSVWALVTESMTSRVAFYNMQANVVLLFISMAALYSWAHRTSIYSPYWICTGNIGNPPSLNNQIQSLKLSYHFTEQEWATITICMTEDKILVFHQPPFLLPPISCFSVCTKHNRLKILFIFPGSGASVHTSKSTKYAVTM